MKWFWLLLAVPALWASPALAAERYVLEVDGLACPFCAYGVEKRLSAVEGVESIDTDIKSGRVVVTLAEGKALTEAAARKAVKDAGFTLKGFSRSTAE